MDTRDSDETTSLTSTVNMESHWHTIQEVRARAYTYTGTHTCSIRNYVPTRKLTNGRERASKRIVRTQKNILAERLHTRTRSNTHMYTRAVNAIVAVVCCRRGLVDRHSTVSPMPWVLTMNVRVDTNSREPSAPRHNNPGFYCPCHCCNFRRLFRPNARALTSRKSVTVDRPTNRERWRLQYHDTVMTSSSVHVPWYSYLP